VKHFANFRSISPFTVTRELYQIAALPPRYQCSAAIAPAVLAAACASAIAPARKLTILEWVTTQYFTGQRGYTLSGKKFTHDEHGELFFCQGCWEDHADVGNDLNFNEWPGVAATAPATPKEAVAAAVPSSKKGAVAARAVVAAMNSKTCLQPEW
jgi:hypothetical protein